jgi:hypothetical protein
VKFHTVLHELAKKQKKQSRVNTTTAMERAVITMTNQSQHKNSHNNRNQLTGDAAVTATTFICSTATLITPDPMSNNDPYQLRQHAGTATPRHVLVSHGSLFPILCTFGANVVHFIGNRVVRSPSGKLNRCEI